MSERCENIGCGCWDRLCLDNCAANTSGGNSSICESRAETKTESITVERLEGYKTQEHNLEVFNKEYIEQQATLERLAGEVERLRESMCVYAREELCDIHFENDQEAIEYFLEYKD